MWGPKTGGGSLTVLIIAIAVRVPGFSNRMRFVHFRHSLAFSFSDTHTQTGGIDGNAGSDVAVIRFAERRVLFQVS